MKHIYSLSEVEGLAKKNGWLKIDYQENIGMVSFKKDRVRVNVYLSRMTVSTAMKHPKKGKTQLFRQDVSLEQLEEIFKNPRTHTNKGYYQVK